MMSSLLSRILIASLFMVILLVPFAGLAPLMLFLFVAGVIWSLGTIIQSFFLIEEQNKVNEDPFYPKKDL